MISWYRRMQLVRVLLIGVCSSSIYWTEAVHRPIVCREHDPLMQRAPTQTDSFALIIRVCACKENRILQALLFIIYNNMKKEYKICIGLIQKAYYANIYAHKCRDEEREHRHLDFYDNWRWSRWGRLSYLMNEKRSAYAQKVQKIKEAIRLIKKYKLPIKRGMNKDVIYFCIHGRQVSFHIFTPHKYKKYRGQRSHCVNGDTFPVVLSSL